MARLAALTFALALLAPLPASAQPADLSGSWLLSVEINGTTTTPKLTLTQSADSLSGNYASETLGTASIRGTVDGNGFTISFTASMQGQPIPVRYQGTLEEDGTLKGTLQIADGAISGTFTGRKEPAGSPSAQPGLHRE